MTTSLLFFLWMLLHVEGFPSTYIQQTQEDLYGPESVTASSIEVEEEPPCPLKGTTAVPPPEPQPGVIPSEPASNPSQPSSREPDDVSSQKESNPGQPHSNDPGEVTTETEASPSHPVSTEQDVTSQMETNPTQLSFTEQETSLAPTENTHQPTESIVLQSYDFSASQPEDIPPQQETIPSAVDNTLSEEEEEQPEPAQSEVITKRLVHAPVRKFHDTQAHQNDCHKHRHIRVVHHPVSDHDRNQPSNNVEDHPQAESRRITSTIHSEQEDSDSSSSSCSSEEDHKRKDSSSSSEEWIYINEYSSSTEGNDKYYLPDYSCDYPPDEIITYRDDESQSESKSYEENDHHTRSRPNFPESGNHPHPHPPSSSESKSCSDSSEYSEEVYYVEEEPERPPVYDEARRKDCHDFSDGSSSSSGCSMEDEKHSETHRVVKEKHVPSRDQQPRPHPHVVSPPRRNPPGVSASYSSEDSKTVEEDKSEDIYVIEETSVDDEDKPSRPSAAAHQVSIESESSEESASCSDDKTIEVSYSSEEYDEHRPGRIQPHPHQNVHPEPTPRNAHSQFTPQRFPPHSLQSPQNIHIEHPPQIFPHPPLQTPENTHPPQRFPQSSQNIHIERPLPQRFPHPPLQTPENIHIRHPPQRFPHPPLQRPEYIHPPQRFPSHPLQKPQNIHIEHPPQRFPHPPLQRPENIHMEHPSQGIPNRPPHNIPPQPHQPPHSAPGHIHAASYDSSTSSGSCEYSSESVDYGQRPSTYNDHSSESYYSEEDRSGPPTGRSDEYLYAYESGSCSESSSEESKEFTGSSHPRDPSVPQTSPEKEVIMEDNGESSEHHPGNARKDSEEDESSGGRSGDDKHSASAEEVYIIEEEDAGKSPSGGVVPTAEGSPLPHPSYPNNSGEHGPPKSEEEEEVVIVEEESRSCSGTDSESTEQGAERTVIIEEGPKEAPTLADHQSTAHSEEHTSGWSSSEGSSADSTSEEHTKYSSEISKDSSSSSSEEYLILYDSYSDYSSDSSPEYSTYRGIYGKPTALSKNRNVLRRKPVQPSSSDETVFVPKQKDRSLSSYEEYIIIKKYPNQRDYSASSSSEEYYRRRPFRRYSRGYRRPRIPPPHNRDFYYFPRHSSRRFYYR